MIPQNFHVGRTVGEGHSRATDVVRLRKALRKTGHSRPAAQPSGIYDRSAHDAVLRFQRDFGLREDGIVRPGGATQTAINIAHAALESGGSEGYAQIREPFAALHRAGFRFLRTDENGRELSGRWSDAEGRPVAPDQIQGLLKEAKKPGIQLAMYRNRDSVTGRRRFPGQRGNILEGGGGGGGRGHLPAGELLKGLSRYLFGESAKSVDDADKPSGKPTPSSRSVPPNNPSHQIPPFPAEPPPEPDKGKGNEPLKPEEQLPTVLPGAQPVEGRPGLFIFPDQSEIFNKPQIVKHKGGDKTRDFNEEVRDWFLTPEREAEGWKHFKGGRERPDDREKSPRDRELKEEFIPNPVKDFENEQIKEKVDGRPGSKYVDLTFYNEKTRRWLRIQTADVDKNGIPTQREQENADKIRKRVRGDLLLIRKPWQ